MRFAIINGPNLNLLGTREPGIYGAQSFESYLSELRTIFPEHQLEYFQSNIEGEIINYLHTLIDACDGLVINPGGYSHTSVAIADALRLLKCRCVEVHISNVYAREEFRKQLITASSCTGVISGLGLAGYQHAIGFLAGPKQ
ncbi:MAG: 3-dehydroquinate dehydratase [Flavobacteriales bacterium]|nr:3-dehydroquinate dehydratase [Flavobacteriales bacterium]